ncbi:MAG: methyl-accepting chemotaxis protein [Gammaproteobacteria bacterium]
MAQQSIALARELKDSSDELTRLARTYVVTGNPDYERAYWEVLAVRNGESARADGRKIPLRKLMQDIGFTDSELGRLDEAEGNSNDLVATETAAFQALEGRFTDRPGGTSRRLSDYSRTAPPDRAFAIKIMHDKRYHREKARIMAPIQTVERMVEARTHEATEVAINTSRQLILVGGVLGITLIVVLVVSYLLAQRPLLGALDAVRVRLLELGTGHLSLDNRLTMERQDEVGALADAFNQLMEQLQGLMRRVQSSGVLVASSSAQLNASARGFEATLNEQVASTQEVMARARDIATTADALVGTMRDVADLSSDAAQTAGLGESGLVQMRATMAAMEAASHALTEKLASISGKVVNVSTVVTTINKVAEQTNLLSLNAAIEAAKAGEFGQGFVVVAREIRRLADQTAVATLDISDIVAEMQSSVSSGVMSMETFARDVGEAVREVQVISGRMRQIIDQVQSLKPQFVSVSDGVWSQSIGAGQISEAMSQLAEATRASAASQREASQAIELLDQAAQGLQAEVLRFTGDAHA